jgi:truncated hemoglobin YjbI
VAHAFGHGFRPDHTERLAAYWGEALGGPATYSSSYGDETAVVRIHSGNGPHDEMDRRAIACFEHALVDAGLAGDDRLRRTLRDYFAWAATTTMARYHARGPAHPAVVVGRPRRRGPPGHVGPAVVTAGERAARPGGRSLQVAVAQEGGGRRERDADPGQHGGGRRRGTR